MLVSLDNVIVRRCLISWFTQSRHCSEWNIQTNIQMIICIKNIQRYLNIWPHCVADHISLILLVEQVAKSRAAHWPWCHKGSLFIPLWSVVTLYTYTLTYHTYNDNTLPWEIPLEASLWSHYIHMNTYIYTIYTMNPPWGMPFDTSLLTLWLLTSLSVLRLRCTIYLSKISYWPNNAAMSFFVQEFELVYNVDW